MPARGQRPPGTQQPPPAAQHGAARPSLLRLPGRAEADRLFLCAAWRATAHAERDRRSHEPGGKRPRFAAYRGALPPAYLALPGRVVSAPAAEPRPDASQTSQRPSPG